MVNAPQMWREKRAREIGLIQNSLRQSVKEGKKLNYDHLILSVMSNVGVSRKTASEYVEIALFNEGMDLTKKEVQEKI